MAHNITIIKEGKADIELVRGDSLILTLNMSRQDETYSPEQGDQMIFTLRKNYKGLTNDAILLQKTVDLYDSIILEIEPEDTESLEYGSYKYDMEFDSYDGKVDTVMQGTFKLAKEVT